MFDADLIHRRQLLCNSAATLGPILILVATLPLFVEEPAFVSSPQRKWEYKPTPIPETEPQRCTMDLVHPVLVHRVAIQYFRRLKVRTISIFQNVVTKQGLVRAVRVLQSSGDSGFDERAKAAFLQWRYKPATLNGHPIAVYSTITVRIYLR